MTRIILARHGESEDNASHRFAGHTDVPLSPLGREQAQAMAAYLADRERIAAVYASDLARVTDTVRPAAERFGLPVIPESSLREIFGGAWEGVSHSLLRVRYAADYAQWATDLPHSRCTGGESIEELYGRAVRAVLRIAAAHEGKTVLIGTHYTPVLAVISHALCGSIREMTEELAPPNASLHIFRYENGVLTPEALHITAHLEAAGLLPAAPSKA